MSAITLTLPRLHAARRVALLPLVLFSATVVLVVTYVWLVSYTTTRSFAVRELEREVEAVTLENEVLASEVAAAKRLLTVTVRMQILGLGRPVATRYVSPDDALARR